MQKYYIFVRRTYNTRVLTIKQEGWGGDKGSKFAVMFILSGIDVQYNVFKMYTRRTN